MSEKGENDQYRDRIKKADDGRSLEINNIREERNSITNKDEKKK